MKNHNLLIVLFLSITAIFCLKILKTEEEHLKEVGWLVGTWQNKTEKGTFTETWEITENTTQEGHTYKRLEAFSCLIKDRDTLFSEEVVLFKMDKWMYSVLASGQNDGKSVVFTSTKITDTELVFENQEHDFPKKIVYTLITPDSLYAEISGDGKNKDFRLKE
ncbi:MAG: DUF6265 family protein [Flavobacterium sp.]